MPRIYTILSSIVILLSNYLVFPDSSLAINVCIASASNPTLIEGQLYGCSVDLIGRKRVTGLVTVVPPTLTKCVQGSTGYSVQALKDAGRNPVVFYVNGQAMTTSLSLINFNINSGGTVTNNNQYTVTAGKILSIQNVTFTVKPGSRNCPGQLYLFSGNPVTTSSAILDVISQIVIASSGSNSLPISKNYFGGLQVKSGNQLGISTETASTTCTITMSVTGFEY